MRKKTSFFNYLIISLVSLALITSCKTTRNISYVETKPLSVSKIIKKIEKESPQYKSYESKKVAIDLETKNLKTSLTAQVSIVKNKSILLNARKLSLPVGKAVITNDSVKFINYLDKSYLVDDIASLQKLFGFDANFELVQSLFTADFNKLIETYTIGKELTSEIDSNMYRINRKIESKQKRIDENKFSKFSIWVDPQLFVVRKVILHNTESNETITLNYNDYKNIGRSLFPQEIKFEHASPNQKTKVGLSFSKPTLNDVKDVNFAIPEKYEKLKLTRK